MVSINWNKHMVTDPINLADYIELTLALDGEHNSFEFGADDFTNAIREEAFSTVHADPSAMDEETSDFIDGDEADETNEYYESAVALIGSRSRWLGDLYPFAVEDNEVRLTLGPDRRKWAPYIFLLACSHHSLMERNGLKLEQEFEGICKEAMAALFSEKAEVFSFSQFSDDRRQMGHSARRAVKHLAEKLNTRIIVDEGEIPTSSNEFGIDIAAIDAIGDKLGCPFFAFAQCTVSGDPKRWEAKKDEAQANIGGLGTYINIGAPHSNFFFVPHLPRERANKWSVYPHQISNCIFCDRYRICKAIWRLNASSDNGRAQAANRIIENFMDNDGKKLLQDNLPSYSTNS